MGKAKRKHDPEHWGEKYGCDGRPPIQAPVRGLVDPDGLRPIAKRNTNHCALCRLHHLGYLKDRVSDSSDGARAISDMRHSAGERLQDDHALTGQASIKSTLGALAGGGSACGPAEIAQMRIDADRRKAAALMAVGTTARFLLTKLVIEDLSAHDVAGLLRIDRQAVTPMLRVALDALAAHYGMAPKDSGRIRAETIHPFQEDGF